MSDDQYTVIINCGKCGRESTMTVTSIMDARCVCRTQED